ncbi:MAG: hypothetical protein JXQ71_11765 [Verrucomicrobia bacterium]|nr:hypothetical protein [Verrucomicrobiota bacterium]
MTLAWWTSAASGLAAQSTNLLSADLDLPGASLSLLRVTGALVLVVAIFVLSLWAYRRWQHLTPSRGRRPG